MITFRNVSILLGAAFLCLSCSDDNEEDQFGNVQLNFEHRVDGSLLELNSMDYINAAGNEFEITEIQWFVSDLTLNKADGSSLLLGGGDFSHYIDTNLPETSDWSLQDDIPAGEFSSISITFGLKGEKNLPNQFTNLPESAMEWPFTMGGENGGYHYMKMNGFWMDLNAERTPFNFHMGVGEIEDTEGNSEYIQNWFEVELTDEDFMIKSDQVTQIKLIMNIENWFKNPNVYDHNVYGGKIMKNQGAMKAACDNAEVDVFSIEVQD